MPDAKSIACLWNLDCLWKIQGIFLLLFITREIRNVGFGGVPVLDIVVGVILLSDLR